MSKHTITSLGAERLIGIADQIELHAERFNYGTWYSADVRPTKGADMLINNCGTTGCVAGWAVAIGLHEELIDPAKVKDYMDLSEEAAKYLGLSKYGGQDLFFSRALYAWRRHNDPEWRSVEERVDNHEITWDEAGTDPDYWSNAEAVEVAKMLRAIAHGEHPDWEVID